MEIVKSILENINQLHKEKKFTKTSLHRITGYGRPRVDNILDGISPLTLEFLLAVVEVSGKPIGYFIGEDESEGSIRMYLDKIQALSEENGRLKYRLKQLEGNVPTE